MISIRLIIREIYENKKNLISDFKNNNLIIQKGKKQFIMVVLKNK